MVRFLFFLLHFFHFDKKKGSFVVNTTPFSRFRLVGHRLPFFRQVKGRLLFFRVHFLEKKTYLISRVTFFNPKEKSDTLLCKKMDSLTKPYTLLVGYGKTCPFW